MTPISRRTLFAVVMLAAILTIAIAVPLQAATFVSPTPVPRPQPRPVACSGFYYRVLPGDTLSRIGVRFGVSVYNLQRCNGLGSSTRIFAGELLLIPRGYGYFPPRYPAPIHGGACWYRVHWGDTLSRIPVVTAPVSGTCSGSITSAIRTSSGRASTCVCPAINRIACHLT